MRKFKLQNNVGAEWDLMDKTAYFNAPDGLGFEKEISAMQAGYSWLITEDYLGQKSISGEMVFFSYEKYQSFVSFVTKDPLTLLYSPISKWYRISCKVQIAQKSEFKSGYLSVPITFLCLGTWHEAIIVSQAQLPSGNLKKYSYTYPYVYAETAAGTARIKNGDLVSPCKIHIFGPVTNPNWVLAQGGKRLLTGRVVATIPAGNKIVIDADPATMEIAEYSISGEFVQNLYQSSDFSTARFIYAPAGESTLAFSHEGTADISASVEVEKLAYSV